MDNLAELSRAAQSLRVSLQATHNQHFKGPRVHPAEAVRMLARASARLLPELKMHWIVDCEDWQERVGLASVTYPWDVSGLVAELEMIVQTANEKAKTATPVRNRQKGTCDEQMQQTLQERPESGTWSKRAFQVHLGFSLGTIGDCQTWKDLVKSRAIAKTLAEMRYAERPSGKRQRKPK